MWTSPLSAAGNASRPPRRSPVIGRSGLIVSCGQLQTPKLCVARVEHGPLPRGQATRAPVEVLGVLDAASRPSASAGGSERRELEVLSTPPSSWSVLALAAVGHAR